jgi:hypothetical protein
MTPSKGKTLETDFMYKKTMGKGNLLNSGKRKIESAKVGKTKYVRRDSLAVYSAMGKRYSEVTHNDPLMTVKKYNFSNRSSSMVRQKDPRCCCLKPAEL